MIEYDRVKTALEREKAYRLRYVVFVKEQNVPEDMELDEFDAEAVHVLAREGDQMIGTGRLVVEGERGRIGRMAVVASRRKEGIGRGLMEELEKAARLSGLTEIYLHAQIHAKGFYEKLGYQPRGEEFDEAGIAHIEMYKRI